MEKEFLDYSPPSWHTYFMKQVYLVAEKSKDPRTKIGAVLVKDNRVISTGYNGFPIGVNDLEERYVNRETKYKFIVHSEHNAILSCARFGVSSLNSTLYTNAYPCNDCMKAIIQGGIIKIIIHKQYPKMSNMLNFNNIHEISKQMSEESGIEVEIFDKVLNMIGYLDGKIIEV